MLSNYESHIPVEPTVEDVIWDTVQLLEEALKGHGITSPLVEPDQNHDIAVWLTLEDATRLYNLLRKGS